MDRRVGLPIQGTFVAILVLAGATVLGVESTRRWTLIAVLPVQRCSGLLPRWTDLDSWTP